MPLQYLKDSSGITTAVVIPIEDWQKITDKYADLSELEKGSHSRQKPSELAGTLSTEGYAVLSREVKNARGEWERNI